MNSKSINIASLIALILVIVSCGKSENSDKIIILKSVKQYDFKDLEINKMIQFEATKSNLLGMYLDIRLTRDNFWVLDLNNSNSIFGFDSLGRALGYVAQVGEGPNTILNIRDFLVSNDTIIVLSNLGDQVEISNWNKHNSLLDKRRVEANGYTFIDDKIKNKWHLYSGYNKVAGKYRLNRYDKDFNKDKEYLENDFGDEILPFLERSFFQGYRRTLFKESLKSKVYELGEQDLKLVYEIDFGSYQVPDLFWEKDPFEGFEMINENGFANISFIAESEKHFLIEIQIQEDGVLRKELLFIEKSSGKRIKVKVDQDQSAFFYSPFGFDESGNVLFYAYSGIAEKFIDSISDRVKENLKFEKDGNPVIIYAKVPDFK